MAKAIGVNLSVEDMYEKTLLVCTQTANNNSSMYSDILRKRSTEVDFINGYRREAARSCTDQSLHHEDDQGEGGSHPAVLLFVHRHVLQLVEGISKQE